MSKVIEMSHSRPVTRSALYRISAYLEILLQVVIFSYNFNLLAASVRLFVCLFVLKAIFDRIFLLLRTEWAELFGIKKRILKL